MNEQAVSSDTRSLHYSSTPSKRDALAISKALLSVLVIVGAYFTIGTSLKAATSDLMIAGYEVKWSILTSAILSAGVLLWVKQTRGSLVSLGFKRPPSYAKGIAMALASVVVAYAAVLIPVSTLSYFGLLPAPTEGVSKLIVDGPNLALALLFSQLLMWVNAAFGEELLFRGFLQNNLERAFGGESWRNGLMAAGVVALAFGAMHVPSQGPTGLFVTGIVGLMLGALFILGKRSLFTVVMAHGFINTTSHLLTAAQG